MACKLYNAVSTVQITKREESMKLLFVKENIQSFFS